MCVYLNGRNVRLSWTAWRVSRFGLYVRYGRLQNAMAAVFYDGTHFIHFPPIRIWIFVCVNNPVL